MTAASNVSATPLNALASLAAQGLSAPAIARRFGVHHSTIQRAAKRHSIPIVSGYRERRITPTMFKAAVELHGPSPRRVARMLGVSLGYTRKLLEEAELGYDAAEVKAKAAAARERLEPKSTRTTITWRGGMLTVVTKTRGQRRRAGEERL